MARTDFIWGMHMSARNHEVTTKQQLLDVNGQYRRARLVEMPVAAVFQRAHQSDRSFRIQRDGTYYLVSRGVTVRSLSRFQMMGMLGYSRCRCLIFPGSRGSIRKRF